MHKFNLNHFVSNEDKKTEELLFKELNVDDIEARPIFVVCSPRVGSTLIYQALVNTFNFAYFSNTTNDLFSKTPSIGVLRESVNSDSQYLLNYFSQYGKTSGSRETSESSAIFGNWYGGKHPSEINSADILSEELGKHMQDTFSAIKAIRGTETVTKNPWNSFRIRSFNKIFPKSIFIWIRRSIDVTAISDLENRMARGNPNEVWNSATCGNYKEIQKHPYHEQVVLQQYHYSLSIQNALSEITDNRFCEVWYEDLCSNPRQIFSHLHQRLTENDLTLHDPKLEVLDEIKPSKGLKHKLPEDFKKIQHFINSDERYSSLLHGQK